MASIRASKVYLYMHVACLRVREHYVFMLVRLCLATAARAHIA